MTANKKRACFELLSDILSAYSPAVILFLSHPRHEVKLLHRTAIPNMAAVNMFNGTCLNQTLRGQIA